MIAIAKREFASLFNTVIGWLFVGFLIALFGLYFFLYNLSYGLPQIANTLSAVTFVFMVAVPILTMRVLSEERRNKTDQLIMTAPVSTWQIVFGKYLALVAVFCIPVLLMAVSPLILSLFGEASYADSYLALLGFVLYGMLTMAIGLFISSLTESVVISAVVSFVLLFIGYMMSNITEAVFSEGNIIATILNCYDIIGPLDDLSSGSLNLVSIVYYVSLIGLFLFFTVESIEKRRWSVSVRKVSSSVFSFATIAIVTAAVIAVNIVVAKLPVSKTTYDLTDKKYYSLTSTTKKYLKNYNEKVIIYVVGKKADIKKNDRELFKILQKYDESCKTIKVKYVDTEKNPTFVQKYSESDLSNGSVIVVSDKRNKAISSSEIYPSEMDYSTYSQQTVGFDGEGQITSALDFVATDDVPKIYILGGHDEVDLGKNFFDVIEKSNFTTEELNFLQADAVPDDAAALIINGAQSDFSDDDVQKVKDYIEKGGKVFTSFDFLVAADLPKLKAIFEDYGVTIEDGVVAELNNGYYYQVPFYLLPEVANSEATADVTGSMSIFTPYSLAISHGEDGDYSYVDLYSTSADATIKGGYNSVEDIQAASVDNSITKEEGDPDGPFALGVQVNTKKGGELFVMGSVYTFTDTSDQMVSYRNSLLFKDILSVMVTQENKNESIVVPVKNYETNSLTINARATLIYGILFVLLIPFGCLVAGLVIWLKRRKK